MFITICVILGFVFLALTFKSEVTEPRKSHAESRFSDRKTENVRAVRSIVDEHKGFTAEVFSIGVCGRREVERIRRLNPGDKTEIRMRDGIPYVYSSGGWIAPVYSQDGSYLEKLLNEGIPFEAYLGGRDYTFLCDDGYDSCRIIIFYKIDGLPPTRVDLL